MDKSRILKLVMNSLEIDKKDPTKINYTMIILDDETSHNNVKLTETAMNSLAKSVKGMPLVAKLIDSENDFGDHEIEIAKDRYGNEYFKRNTIPIGAFTSEGYIEKIEIDGEERNALMGDGVLWVTRYPDLVGLVKDMFDEGIKINTSSEYKYTNSNVSFNEDNEEVHDGEIYFEGIAVLGSDENYVAPAYDTATFTSLNSENTKKFNMLVAQAIKNKNGEKDMKLQTNKISYDSIRKQAENQIRASISDADYLWVSDVTTEDVVVFVERTEDVDYSYFQYNYTITNDVVTVDLESKKQVIETREWKVMSNALDTKVQELETKLNEVLAGKTELETKLNEVTSGKEDLATKLNEANDVIVKLNEQVAELTKLNSELEPYKEKVELAEKEALVAEVAETFEAKFNAVDGQEVFASDEVKTLLNNAIESGEVGLEAKLKLNEKILELASNKLEKTPTQFNQMLNSNKSRNFENLVKTENDLLESLR